MTPTDLKSTRLALGLTKTQMAQALGMEYRHYWRLEAGKRDLTRQQVRHVEGLEFLHKHGLLERFMALL